MVRAIEGIAARFARAIAWLSSPPRAPFRKKAFILEPLEPRLLFSADPMALFVMDELLEEPDGQGAIVLQLDAAANAAADSYTLRLNGENLEFLEGSSVVLSRSLAATSAVVINGEDEYDDTLTVDFDFGGFFSVAGGITFNGGANGVDSLIVTGGSFASIDHIYTETGPGLSGRLVFDDGVQPALAIDYTDLEPLTNTGTAANLVFTLTGADDFALLEDDGVAGNGISRLRSGSGTFETTTFTSNATTSLTINLGSGNDVLAIYELPDFTGALTVNGPAGADSVAFQQDVSLSALTVNTIAGLTSTVADLTVSGAASITTGTISLGNGAGSTVNFGTLNFKVNGNATIVESSDTVLRGTNTASTLNLTSTGSITDEAGTSLTVANNAKFSAAAITLGDNASDITNFTSLTFSSAGAVSIAEDSSVLLTGSNTASSLVLSAGGTGAAIEFFGPLGGGTLEVTNNATLSATSTILLGTSTSETLNFGTLTLNTTGTASAVIAENSDTVLAGSSTVGGMVLTSTGSITDAAGTSLAVSGAGRFSGTSITLGDSASDVTNFGSLTFNSAGAVSIAEDGDTALAGSSTAGSLTLNTFNALTDAAGGSVVVSGNATISAFSVFIADQSTNTFRVGGRAFFDAPLFLTVGANGVTNFGTLAFSTSGQVFLVEDSDTVLSGTSSAESAILVSFGSITDAAGTSLSVTDFAELSAASIRLGDNTGDVTNFGLLTVNSPGSVTITEDSATVLEGSNSVGSLTLTSSGAIADEAGTNVTVSGVANFAGSSITLGDNASDTTNFGSLTLNSGGAASVSEDSDTVLAGASTAGGDISVSTTGQMMVTGSLDSGTHDMSLNAPGGVFFTASALVNVDLGGTAADDFTTITISGGVTLDGTLNAELVNGFTPVANDRFRFMTFDSRTGFFATTLLPADFIVDQTDPTDLELVFSPNAPTIVYVDDDFTGSAGTPIVDADPVASGNQAAVIGVNAFATIQAGVNAVAEGGTVNVNSHGPNAAPTGAYAESVSITKALTLDGNAISGLAEHVIIDPAAGNGITVSGANADNVTILDLRVTGSVDGIHASGSGNLTITNVQADNNTGDGLSLTSVGAVSLNRVTAIGNDPGILVNGAASFSDTDGVYSNNDDHGIQLIDIAGDVTLVRTVADNNDADNNNLGDGLNAAVGSNPVAIGGNMLIQGARFRDSGGANDHQERGVFIESVAASSTITFSDSTGVVQSNIVTGNESKGVFIRDGGTSATFTNGTYSGNVDNGIDVGSLSGAMTLNGVTASNNGNPGDRSGVFAHIVGSFSDTAGTYRNNTASGIYVEDVAGDVTLVRTTAENNDFNNDILGDGVTLQRFTLGFAVAGNLLVEGGSYRDTGGASDHQERGIFVHSILGSMTFQDSAGLVQSVTVTGNEADGVVVAVDGGTSATFINGTYSSNGTLAGHDGIDLKSFSGLVSLSGVTADSNSDTGIRINNAGSVSVTNGSVSSNGVDGLVASTVSGTVTISGGSYNNNGRDGINLASVGDITLDDATASTNANAGVEVTGAASFSDSDGAYSRNNNHGIRLIDIAGLVSATRTTANDNDANNDAIGDGVSMTDGADAGTEAIGSLQVTGGSFSDTAAAGGQRFGIRVGDGLGGAVHSVAGSVVFQSDTGVGPLQHVSVTGNQSSGVEIEDGGTTASFSGNGNYSSNLNAGVAIASLSGGFTASDATFSGNTNHGIQLIDIAGLVSLTRVTANDNDANNGTIGDGVNMVDGALDADTNAIGSLLVVGGSFSDTAAAGGQRYGIRVGNGIGPVVHSVAGTVDFQSDTVAGPLQHVSVTGNQESGVEIEDGGTSASVSGTYSNNLGAGFTIASLSGGFSASSSAFSANGSHGLNLIDIAGTVSLSGVTASDNGGNGLNVVDGGDADTVTVGGLTVSGSTFDDTAAGNAQLFGVLVGDVSGDVLFDDSGASGNDAGGVQIGNVAGIVSFTSTSGASYSNTGGDGIHVASLAGALTVSGISASSNTGDGLEVGSASAFAVFMNGSYSNNGRDGINLTSVGAVTFDDVTASANADAGVQVSGAASFSDSDGVYSSNVNHGIQLIDIAGLVSLTRVTANDNDANNGTIGDGVNMVDGALDADTNAIGSLLVVGGSFSDTAAAGGQRFGIRVGNGIGPVVHSVAGTVDLRSDTVAGPLQHVSITGNQESGVEIEDGGTTASVTGAGSYSGNLGTGFTIASLSGDFTASDGTFSGNGNHGISLIDITGAVSITGSTASDNGGNGLNAVDGGDADTVAVGGLTISGSSFDNTAAGNVQLTGINVGPNTGSATFSDNGARANSVTGNTAGGVVLGPVASDVSITSTNGATYSSNTGGDGISVASFTTSLTVSGVTAGSNAGRGLVSASPTAGAVAVQSSSFSDNGNDGINLTSVGAVTFNDVTASANADAGVQVSGAASFSDSDGVYSSNVNHGIQLIDIAGLVSLTRVTANDNDANLGGVGDGVVMTDGADAGTAAIGSLQVTGGSFQDSAAAGVQRYGIRVGDGVGIGAVHLVGGSIVFQSDSAVGPLQHVTITGNLNSGVEIEGGTSAAFTNGIYSNNGGDGINVSLLVGTLTVSGVTANNNAGDGLDVGFGGSVTFLSGVFSNNTGRGVNLAAGAIVVNGSLAVGTGAIVLSTPGGVFFTADAVLNIDIAGTAPGQFTNVAISGAATLDGTLDAELVGGFVPTAGDRFQFMTFDAGSGSFATTNLPDDFEVRDTTVPVGLELVFAPNDPPVAAGDAYATNEDTPLTVAAPGVLGNDTDPDGDAMTAALVTGPAHGTLTFNGDGSFTYAPGLNFNGSDSFTYQVSDGELESGVATVTLTVNSVNDAPVADNDAYSVNEDNTLTVGAASGVLNGDSDPNDTPPNHLSAILVSNVTHGVLALNADGSFTYTPNANFNGTDAFTYRVRDDGGTARGGVDTGNVATVTLTVNPVNDAPTVNAGADQVVGLQDIDDDDHGKGHDHHDGKHDKDHDRPEAEVTIAAVFDDLELTDRHTATINWGDCTSSTGKVTEPTAAADGSVKGKHTYTKAGVYIVTVTVDDGHGGVTSDTLKITVKQPIDKKNFEARKDEYKLDEDTVLRVNAAHGVLANDRTPSGATLQARVVEGPAHGKLTFNADGSFAYVPDRDFHGTDSFWYEFTDQNNVSRAVEVSLKVKDVKDPPSQRPCVDWKGWV